MVCNPGQLSLAISPWIGEMSTNLGSEGMGALFYSPVDFTDASDLH